jgi:hypothetical protein
MAAVSTTNFKVLNLFKFKAFSLLAALSLNLFLIGCGGSNGNNPTSSPAYSVSFYSENLDLLAVYDNLPSGHIVEFDSNKTVFSISDWYLAGDDTSVTSYTLTNKDVRFYAVQNVKEITTQNELNNVRNDLGSKYILLKDIELNATKAGFDNSNDEGWNPIGNSNTNYFRGIFNGNGNKITNLWINRTTDVIGLFGYIENAQIRNLGVETAEGKEIRGNNQTGSIGGIAGFVYNGSNIANSYFIGNVSGSSYVGGSSYVSVGGIAGTVYNGSNIVNSYSAGNINDSYYSVGGIAGVVGDSSNIINSYSTANISGVYSVGGIAGIVYIGSITNSYSTGNISGEYRVGGIAGYIHRATIQNNAAINPSVTGTNDVSRVIGDISPLSPSTVLDNFARIDMSVNGNTVLDSDVNGIGKADNEFLDEDTYKSLNWDFTNIWTIPSSGGYPIFKWQK